MSGHVDRLTQQALTTATVGGDEMRQATERLLPALESAVRLMLAQAITEAADDITAALHRQGLGTIVETRLTDDGIKFHLTDAPGEAAPALPPAPEGGDLSRLTLRLPQSLKNEAETAAGTAQQSLNTWVVEAMRHHLARPSSTSAPRPTRGWL